MSGTVTLCSGKPITLQGDGKFVTSLQGDVSGPVIKITQTNVSQLVSVRDISFSSSSGTPTYALDISFPAAPSVSFQNLLISDVAVLSTLMGGTTTGTYVCGIRLDGAWQSQINNFTFNGAVFIPPVAGSCAIEIKNSFNTTIDRVSVYNADRAIYQSDYSEYIAIRNPIMENINYGLYNALGSTRNGKYGLSYYVSDGEIDANIVGVALSGVQDAWIHHNHIGLRSSPGTGVSLASADGAIVTENIIEQLGSNTGATGVLISGTALTGNHLVSTNRFKTATNVSITNGSNYFISGNLDFGFGGTYTNSGTGNTITWPGPNGVAASYGGHVLAGSNSQSLIVVPNVTNAVNIPVLEANVPGQPPIMTVDGTDPNIAFVIQGKGTGPISLGSNLLANNGVTAPTITLNGMPMCGAAGLPSGTLCKTSTNAVQVTP